MAPGRALFSWTSTPSMSVSQHSISSRRATQSPFDGYSLLRVVLPSVSGCSEYAEAFSPAVDGDRYAERVPTPDETTPQTAPGGQRPRPS